MPLTGDVCAAALFEPPEFVLVWCNDEYRTFLDEPYRSEGGVGHPYREISPVGYALHVADMQAVSETGEGRSGQDRIFSVEDGIQRYNWTLERPIDRMVLAMISRVPAGSA